MDEQSVVQTRFATSSLVLLRASLGEDLAPAVADGRAVLAETEGSALAGLIDVEQVTFVGTGWSVGLAEEAALKLRESAQFWTGVVRRHGVPPRTHRDRGAGTGHLGVRSGAGGSRGTGRGDRLPVRAP